MSRKSQLLSCALAIGLGGMVTLSGRAEIVTISFGGTVQNPRLDSVRTEVRAIATDARGNIYITGQTSSLELPGTERAFQKRVTSSADGFIAKFDPAGALLWSTFLGGPDPSGPGVADEPRAIAVDGEGSVYVTGRTGSSGFPIANGFQPNKLGAVDGFVAKFDSTGGRLIYSSYIGAPGGSSTGESISVGPAGDVWVALKTSAAQFNVTRDLSTGAGSGAAVVMKLSPAGSPVWTTRLGNRFDYETATVQMAVDTAARPVIVTAGSVIQLDVSGSSQTFSWSMSGAIPIDIAPSVDGGTIVSGRADPNLAVRSAWQSQPDVTGNGFVAVLDANGVARTISYVPGNAAYNSFYFLGFTNPEAKGRWRIATDAQGTLHAAFSVVNLASSPTAGALPVNGAGPVFRTADRGDTWTWSSRGLFGQVSSFAVDPVRGYLYASMIAGIYRSIDHGDSWSLWYASDAGERLPLIAVDPRDPTTMYVFGPGRLTSVDSSSPAGYLIRLEEDGRRKTLLRTFETSRCCDLQSLEVSPHDGSVWLGANDSLQVSFDRGQTWSRRDTGLPPQGRAPWTILFDRRQANVVFAQSVHGVHRTTDHGLSWQSVFTVLRHGGGVEIPAGIGLDPLDSNRFFVSASSGGMYITEDGGRTWQTPFGTIGQPRSIAVSPLLPFAVYTPYSYPGTAPSDDSNFTVAYSRDRGVTWAAARRPPARGDYIVADPIDPDRAFFVATSYAVPLAMRMGRQAQQAGYNELYLSTLPNYEVVAAVAASADGQTVIGLNGPLTESSQVKLVIISR